MIRLYFSIGINAPKEVVWNTMLGENSYREWADVFMPGSYFEGDWSEGSKIFFLAPGETGEMAGMVSRIKENRIYEYISIEHLGILENGEEDTTGEEAKRWAGANENYSFKETAGLTTVQVDTDTLDIYEELFRNTWPVALQKLKLLAEKQVVIQQKY